jgi:hypothetical protein
VFGTGAAVLVEHPAVHDDALADRLAAMGVVADQVVVERAEVGMAERRPGDLESEFCSDSSAKRGERGSRGLVVGRQRRRVQPPVALVELGRLAHGSSLPSRRRSP